MFRFFENKGLMSERRKRGGWKGGGGGGGGGGGAGLEAWIVLAPRSPCLMAILHRKVTAHNNYVLNIFRSI